MKNRKELFIVVSSAAVLVCMVLSVLGFGTGCDTKSKQADCTSKLSQIGKAFFQYAMSYDDFFPTTITQSTYGKGMWRGASSCSSLELLRESDLLTDPKGYICPNSEGRTPASYDARLTASNVSYNWCDDLMGGSATLSPVCCDLRDNHSSTGRFVRGDGSVGVAKGTRDRSWTEDSSFKKFTLNYKE